jgi:hypothetical protein
LPLTALKAVSELLFLMLIKEQNVEECDATDNDSSTVAGYTIIQQIIKRTYKNNKD